MKDRNGKKIVRRAKAVYLGDSSVKGMIGYVNDFVELEGTPMVNLCGRDLAPRPTLGEAGWFVACESDEISVVD